MQIGGGGASDVNILFSDDGAYRNEDYVANQGLAYLGGLVLPAMASNYGAIQLNNPIISGVVAFIDEILIVTDVAGQVALKAEDISIGFFFGNWLSMKQGDPAGQSSIRQLNNTGQVGTHIASFLIDANSPLRIENRFPFALSPGQGILIETGQVNTGLSVMFRGREI